MPPEEFASVRAWKEGVTIHDVETGIARPGEDVIWVSVTAAPLPLEGYGLMICYQDIRRRRLAEAELVDALRQASDARARLEAALEALPVGLVIEDAAGGIIQANPAYERIWGAGRPATRSFEDNREYKARWLDTGREVLPHEWASARAHLRGETVVGQLVEIDRFDGGRTVILNSAAPIFGQDGAITGCAVAVQDVGRLIEAERALERSEAELRTANARLETANNALRGSNEALEAAVAARTADLTRRTAQLRALSLDRSRVEERERQRIARVIHDHLQQLLSLARIKVGMVRGQVPEATGQESLRDLDGLIAESLDITRTIVADLSPTILHRSGLAAALRWLGGWFEARFGLKVDVAADEDLDDDEEARVTLFRSVRELLFNVVKHAHVTSARVDAGRTADGRVRIVVRDEGVGFDPTTLRAWDGTLGTFGLFSLREHLELLGGGLDVDSAPGRGASFTVLGPARRPPA
jgi:signal transduction histidine kinase